MMFLWVNKDEMNTYVCLRTGLSSYMIAQKRKNLLRSFTCMIFPYVPRKKVETPVFFRTGHLSKRRA